MYFSINFFRKLSFDFFRNFAFISLNNSPRTLWEFDLTASEMLPRTDGEILSEIYSEIPPLIPFETAPKIVSVKSVENFVSIPRDSKISAGKFGRVFVRNLNRD